MSDFENVLERLMTDRAFAGNMASDPGAALAGFDLSDDERRRLLAGVEADVRAASTVEQRTSKAGLIGLLGEVTGLVETAGGQMTLAHGGGHAEAVMADEVNDMPPGRAVMVDEVNNMPADQTAGGGIDLSQVPIIRGFDPQPDPPDEGSIIIYDSQAQPHPPGDPDQGSIIINEFRAQPDHSMGPDSPEQVTMR